jgi:uncharacterized protein YwgA
MNTAMNSTLQVAQLLRVLRQVEGRKKLHKEVHILQELGFPFTERFDYSFYGMYSRELRSEVATLVKEKLINETANPNAAGETTYRFESTPELEQFLDRLDVKKEPEWATLAKHLNSLPTQRLEGISTILFLRRAVDERELSARFLALKPHLASIYTRCEQDLKTLKVPKAG